MLLPIVTAITLLLAPFQPDENWTEFRGANGTGHSNAASLPLHWSEKQGVRWKTAISGRGWSSPVIWKEQIWLTSATPEGKQMFLYCVHKETGKILHQSLLFENPSPDIIHDLNSYASPTPVIEEGRVYVHFGTYGTACIDTRTFKPVWSRRDLSCKHSVGPGSSPVLYGSSLILTQDGIDVQYVIALNKKTGKTIWRTQRSIDMTPIDAERRKSFSTPTLLQNGNQPLLITVGGHATYANDARDGKEIWVYRSQGYSTACRPQMAYGLLFLNVGFGEYENLRVIRPNGSGDITRTATAWKYARNVPNKPNMLIVEDLLYMVNDDGGVITCLEAKTGKEVWKERVGGSFSASPLYANGHIYFWDDGGRSLLIKPGRIFQKVAENRLDAGCMATPAISGRALYIRTKTHLYRVE
jgi:outer membrane protein assembly factor BamB